LRSDRPQPRIAPFGPPQIKHHRKRRQRQPQRPIAAEKQRNLARRARRVHKSLVERHRHRQAFVQTQGLSRVHLHAISRDLHLRVLRPRTVSARKHIRPNIRRAFRKNDSRAPRLNWHIPIVARHVPVQLIVIVEKSQRIRHHILNRNRLRRIVRVRHINLQLAIVPHPASLVPQGSPAPIGNALHLQKQRVIQPLRRHVLHRNRPVKPVPRSAHKMHLNILSDVDCAVPHYEDFGLEILDAQLARAQRRSRRKQKERKKNRSTGQKEGCASHASHSVCITPWAC